MDLLFKRYASPFSIINQMIVLERFNEFVTEFIIIKNEDTDNDTFWQMYLHSAFLECTYDEFKSKLGIRKESEPVEKVNFETTIQASREILNNFKPT